MRAVVFLGPTLPVADARALLAADYRPPAAMGDVYEVVERERPDVIAVIDGYFDQVPSVWHKEILYALSLGVRVLGSSSIGALRAAELWPYGMEGVGWVFEAFKNGALQDDDEVALLHADEDTGYRPLSTPMVNLRVGLVRAFERGMITATTLQTMIELAKRCFYPERSWRRLFHDAARDGIPVGELDELRRFIDAERPDIKREDAVELLGLLAASPPVPAASRSRVEFTRTVFWDNLVADERRLGRPSTGLVRREELRRFATATDAHIDQLRRDSLLIHLVQEACEMSGVELTQQVFDDAVQDFRLRHDLISHEAMSAWLERSGLSAAAFQALMHIEAQISRLLAMHARQVNEHLLDALALSGRLAETLDRWAATEATNANAGPQPGPSARVIEEFYRSHVRAFRGPLRDHARNLGFASAAELIDEIRKIYVPPTGK
jgi:hypothetical protein